MTLFIHPSARHHPSRSVVPRQLFSPTSAFSPSLELCYLFSFKCFFFLPSAFPPLPPSVVVFVCLASNSPNPSWAPFMKMQIHSGAGENVNRRKLLRSTNQKRRAIKNRQQQPGDPNSVQPPPEIATHACINPLQAKNMWLKERCCHLLQGTSPLLEKRTLCHCLLALCCLKSDSHLLNIAFWYLGWCINRSLTGDLVSLLLLCWHF